MLSGGACPVAEPGDVGVTPRVLQSAEYRGAAAGNSLRHLAWEGEIMVIHDQHWPKLALRTEPDACWCVALNERN